MPETEGDEIPTIDPEKEPEYVGAHSAIVAETCQHWIGETKSNVERCDREATHTIVIWDGTKLMDMASCDECGEPEDVDRYEREWSGELVETPNLELTTIDSEPVLKIGGAYIQLRTQVRVDSDENFLGDVLVTEAETQCDDGDCWFNVWPASGGKTPRILIQPERWESDDE